MIRVVESRRARLHRDGGLAAAFVEFTHLRLAEELRAPIALGVRTLPTFCRSESEILTQESRPSSDVPPSPGPAPFFQHQATMRITHTLQLESDLEFSHAAQDTFTVVADVTLSDEVTPVRWISVERNGVELTGFELATATAPLSALEDAILTEAMLRRSAMAKATAAESAERSVA